MDIMEIIKKASLDAVENSSPTNILFGNVINIDPLEIQVEQKLILTKEFLVLTKNVIDYETQVSMYWNTENTNLDAIHSHEVSGNIQVNSTIEPNDNKQEITNTVNSNMRVEDATINFQHSHTITGIKTIKIYNGLKQGDKVILIQQRGGQKFVVLDKIY